MQLGAAYALLERLCQQYVQAALQALRGQAVPRWHHQLLLNWCKAQPSPPEPYVTREEVLHAHPDLWPEVSSLASTTLPTRLRLGVWMSAVWFALSANPSTPTPLRPPLPSGRWLWLSDAALGSSMR